MGLWGGLPPSESFAAAIKLAQPTALDLEPGLGEAHASLGFALWAYDGDEEAAGEAFQPCHRPQPELRQCSPLVRVIELSPQSTGTRHRQPGARPKRRSQLCLIAAALGFVYYNARQYDPALRLLTSAARELPQSGVIQEMLTWCYLKTGDKPSALECAQRAVQLSDHATPSLPCARSC